MNSGIDFSPVRRGLRVIFQQLSTGVSQSQTKAGITEGSAVVSIKTWSVAPIRNRSLTSNLIDVQMEPSNARPTLPDGTNHGKQFDRARENTAYSRGLFAR